MSVYVHLELVNGVIVVCGDIIGDSVLESVASHDVHGVVHEVMAGVQTGVLPLLQAVVS